MAPQGRDAAVAHWLLQEAGIAAMVCSTLDELQASLNDAICFAVIADEGLHSADLRPLSRWLEAQPAWSDLPIIILTHHADGSHLQESKRLADLLGNVTFIERPFHPLTFLSVVKTAHQGRLRQYEARALIEQLRTSEETLERRVQERTLKLNLAHEALIAEVEQREKTEARLRQSQKLEMIGQLTGGVAHDFNNLLMAVIANLNLLRKRRPADPVDLRLIDGAIEGAKRGAALTQRLLAFARRQDLKTEAADLVALVKGLQGLIERSIGSQIELILDIATDMAPVMVDVNQVELAILNLVINSRDAMPEGGRITLRIDQVQSDGTGGLPRGSFARLTVADTGIGMDSETLQKATEPFFSTKELGKGTGLGLSMTHGLARQLGGALHLSSRVGHGTTVELLVPSTTNPIAKPMNLEQTAQDVTCEKLTVLVVDDDPLIAMSTSMMVEDLGHEVIEVHSGSDALDVLRSGQNIDLLLTDFSMPKMNGAQLAEAAKQIRPGLPILIATGYAELSALSELQIPRIRKPYEQEQLAEAVDEAIRTRG